MVGNAEVIVKFAQFGASRLLKNAPKQRARRYRMCNPEVKRTRCWELVLPETCFSAACPGKS
jgi:hypothetical protein